MQEEEGEEAEAEEEEDEDEEEERETEAETEKDGIDAWDRCMGSSMSQTELRCWFNWPAISGILCC